MRKKESAVQVTNVAETFFRCGRAIVLRLGEAFEEEELEEVLEVPVSPSGAAFIQLRRQVFEVTVIDEALALQEPDKHEPVQEYRGVPTALAVIGDPGDQLDELKVLLLELLVELLCNLLDV